MDPGIVSRFENIEGSRILHLFHNKHELTWCRFIPNMLQKSVFGSVSSH
jgi:hypothetical protein